MTRPPLPKAVPNPQPKASAPKKKVLPESYPDPVPQATPQPAKIKQLVKPQGKKK